MQKRIERRAVNVHVGGIGGGTSTMGGGSGVDFGLPDEEEMAKQYGLAADVDGEGDSRREQELLAELSQAQERITEYGRVIDSMKEKLVDKNRRLDHVCTILEAIEPVPGVDPSRVQGLLTGALTDEDVDLRDSKIVSLAKKSHNLQSQLNTSRATNEKMSIDIVELKKKLASATAEVEQLKTQLANRPSTTSDSKVYNRHALASQAKRESEETTAAQSARQIREAMKSLEEHKRRVKDLTEENQKLTRALRSEIGEGVMIDQVVEPGWRGRAQQIVLLKAKVKQLENGNGGSRIPSTRTASRDSTRPDVDARAEEDLVEMSRERRAITEALTEERVRLVEEKKDLEKRLSAQKARTQILENDLKRMRENIGVALDKSNSDDELLEALRGEIQKLTFKLRQSEESKATLQRKGQTQLSDNGDWALKQQQFETELLRLQRLCKNQSEQLESQDVTIRELRRRLQEY